MEREYPRVEVRCNWSSAFGDATGQEVTQGWQVAPGLAVVDLSGMDHTSRHWAVVHIGAGEVMTNGDLCEECAFAAARVLSAVSWDGPVDALKADPQATSAVEMADDTFGPCFPPPGAEEHFGFPMRVAGHVPGMPRQQPEGLPRGMEMLLPADMPGDLPPLPPEITERLQEAVDWSRRPWYEQKD